MQAIEQINGRAELMELKARYFRFVDTKKWAELNELFMEDCFFSAPDDFSGVEFVGRKAIIEGFRNVLEDVLSIHHGFMPEFTFESPDVARGIWAMEDILWFGKNANVPVSYLHGYGHYHEHYVRIDGFWRFKNVELRRLRVETQPR